MIDKLPTIDIKGKEYVMVKNRLLAFNEKFKNGSIVNEIISELESKTVIVKSTITPDIANPARVFIGHSQAVIGQGMINTTSALENCETSSVGRALALMGIGVIESVASADEIVKSNNATPTKYAAQATHFCETHKRDLKYREETNGNVWDHRQLIDDVWNRCYGDGVWKPAQK